MGPIATSGTWLTFDSAAGAQVASPPNSAVRSGRGLPSPAISPWPVAGFFYPLPSGLAARILPAALPDANSALCRWEAPRRGRRPRADKQARLTLTDLVMTALVYWLPWKRCHMISTSIPAFDEEKSLAILYREIDECTRMGSTWTSCSSTTAAAIRAGRSSALARNTPACGASMRRLRQGGGSLGGSRAASWHALSHDDADLQDDPHEIPLSRQDDQGFDVVAAETRHDPWHKVLPAPCFNWMVSWLTGVRLRPQLRHEVLPVDHLSRNSASMASCTVHSCAGGRLQSQRAGVTSPPRLRPLEYGFRRFAKGFSICSPVPHGAWQRPSRLGGTGRSFRRRHAGRRLTITWFVNVIFQGSCPSTSGRIAYSVAALLAGTMMSMGFLPK